MHNKYLTIIVLCQRMNIGMGWYIHVSVYPNAAATAAGYWWGTFIIIMPLSQFGMRMKEIDSMHSCRPILQCTSVIIITECTLVGFGLFSHNNYNTGVLQLLNYCVKRVMLLLTQL